MFIIHLVRRNAGAPQIRDVAFFPAAELLQSRSGPNPMAPHPDYLGRNILKFSVQMDSFLDMWVGEYPLASKDG